MLLVQVICTWKASLRGKFDSETGHGGVLHEVLDDIRFVDADGQDLALAIHTNQTGSLGIRSRGEDCFTGDAVHEDTSASLEVVKVDEAVFRD